jgi:hypothetical protein
MSQLAQQFVPQASGEGGEQGRESCDNGGEDGCEGGECGEEGTCGEGEHTEAKSASTSTSTSSTAPPSNAPPSMFNNPLFSELASEIGNTFDFAEMEKDGKPQNIGDALSRFMSGNNPAKLMELVGKFGGKLQTEVKNGNINPADLLKQTMSAAGGQQNLEKMMNNPQVKNKMNQMQGQNATRDRLRAKLEKKNAEKQ